MNEYTISQDMVAAIKSIAGLEGAESPCHKKFYCTGVVCGLLQMSRMFVVEFDKVQRDYSGYGEQMINLAVTVYRRSLESGEEPPDCTVSGMHQQLLRLGQLAYPQFLKRDQE